VQIVNSTGKYQNSFKGRDNRHILYADVLLVEPVLYLDPVSNFQFSETTEKSEYFVGFSDNIGDALTFKILKNDLVTVLH
jgi:hypothetical protein